MGGSVIRLDEGPVSLLELRRGAGEGELIVVEAPLNVKMGLHEVLIALAFGALDRLVLNLQPRTDRFEVIGGVGPPLSDTRRSGAP
jgi:hypothetical protein